MSPSMAALLKAMVQHQESAARMVWACHDLLNDEQRADKALAQAREGYLESAANWEGAVAIFNAHLETTP